MYNYKTAFFSVKKTLPVQIMYLYSVTVDGLLLKMLNIKHAKQSCHLSSVLTLTQNDKVKSVEKSGPFPLSISLHVLDSQNSLVILKKTYSIFIFTERSKPFSFKTLHAFELVS